MGVRNWANNLTRIVFGRPAWSADAEFAYYRVDRGLCLAHRRRQEEFAAEAHFTGLQIARAHGLLDARTVAGAHVLDIGAGECSLSEALAFGLGAASVWALDAVPKQIWAAAERYPDDARLKFLLADAQALPFADGSFDIVTANLVLHHLEPLAPVLSEVARVLRPGGRFTASEPAPLMGLLTHEQTSTNEAPLPPGRVARALRAAGLDDVSTEYHWSRMNSSRLGPLSPGYRVSARRPGGARQATPRLTRSLEPSRLPGLQIDPTVAFRGQIAAQEAAILGCL